MTPERPRWPSKAIAVLVPLVGIDLIIQYIAGLGTNVWAPSNGFTMNTDFGIYDLHWTNGYALGILSIVLVAVALFSRQMRNIAGAVVILIAVLVAAFAGMAFVNNVPNPPSASLVMGIAFLVAFAVDMAMAFRVMMGGATPGAPSVAPS